MLGNDIVDIRFCELPMHRHVRYVDRVCNLQEASAVRRSADPAKALAVIWAAKEAAYKFFYRVTGLRHFVPREFVLQIQDIDVARIAQKLSLVYAGRSVEISVFSTETWVHAIATPPFMDVEWKVREIDECSLEGRKATNESEAVRYLTRNFMDELGLQDVSLQFDGKLPQLFNEHRNPEFPTFVSLSHHGAYAAVAIGWPVGQTMPQRKEYENFNGPKTPEDMCFTCTA